MLTNRIEATYCQFCRGEIESDNKSSYHLSCKNSVENYKVQLYLLMQPEFKAKRYFQLNLAKKWIMELKTLGLVQNMRVNCKMIFVLFSNRVRIYVREFTKTHYPVEFYYMYIFKTKTSLYDFLDGCRFSQSLTQKKYIDYYDIKAKAYSACGKNEYNCKLIPDLEDL